MSSPVPDPINALVVDFDFTPNDTIYGIWVTWDTAIQRNRTSYWDIQITGDLVNWHTFAVTNKPPVRVPVFGTNVFIRARRFVE